MKTRKVILKKRGDLNNTVYIWQRCGANSVRGVTVLRGKYFVEFVVVTGGVTVIFQNPDFVVVDFVVVTSWWI